ncbi:S49 family peptidase [Saliniramus sp.]|uniref:S49 family peptidase n=1 Tax=Saliniramus sp. TaxID=2986772 RepID=UPI0039C97BD1
MREERNLSSLTDRIAAILPGAVVGRKPTIPVVRLNGAIGISIGLRPGLSLASLAPLLERAFSYPRASAVAIAINSPGGSPVQSQLIHTRIRALADEKKLPVYAFCEDAAASGGYMIACAADEIFADASSIVGSIGVVSSGFGFHELISRYGIERRLYTTGEAKAILDPFQPEKAEDVARLRKLQERVFDAFRQLVRDRRGTKLPQDLDHELFSGAFWAGEDAKALGLIDEIGDMRSVLRARFGEKLRLRPIQAQRPGLISQFMRQPPGAGEMRSMIDPREALATLEERALWSRLGL